MKNIFLTLLAVCMGSQAFAGFSTRGGRLAPMAVQVSFGSLGAGIDQKVSAQISAVVKQQERKGLLALTTSKPWGREGEFDLCVEYKNPVDAYKSEQQFSAIAAKAKAPTHVERILNCGGVRVVDPHRR